MAEAGAKYNAFDPCRRMDAHAPWVIRRRAAPPLPVSGCHAHRLLAAKSSDIAAATGGDYFASTQTAAARLGGIEAFVPRGASVGLLVNSPFKNFGALVNPDITLAVIDLCRRAGHHAQFEDQIRKLQYVGGDHVKVDVAGGRVLETVKVVRALQDCGVFINVAFAKHHEGVEYSGLLKNMMELCPFSTNSYFHWGMLNWAGMRIWNTRPSASPI